MSKLHLSRRDLLKAALAVSGAAAGARLAGPLLGSASAAGEPAHFVHIFLNGGFNALFAGNADKFVAGNVFDVTSSNIKEIGNGVVTDAATFGTFLPQIAFDHWGAVGMKHGQALHTTSSNTNSGGERAILRDGDDSALNKLAAAMGGNSAFKAVYFGDRQPAYREQPAFQGVSLQRVSSLTDALKAIGSDPSGAAIVSNGRESSAVSMEAANALSAPQARRNPGRLGTLGGGYASAASAFRVVQSTPLSLDEIDGAYGLNGKTSTDSFAGKLAGAEIMVRGAGTNVVNVTDNGLASWDFHQVSGGKSQNGYYSRRKFLGEGSFGENKIKAIGKFIERMLSLQGRNVVVCVSGEMVRLTNGDHGDGTVAVLFGKTVKQGISFGVDAKSKFAAGTPGVKGFWAAAAAALGVQGQPFGANPHTSIVG